QARMPLEQSAESSSDPGVSGFGTERRDLSRGSVADVEFRKTIDLQARSEGLDRARMPRDLLLRGRFEDATVLLVAMRDQLRGQRDRLNKNPDLPRQVLQWREQMIEAQANLLRAERGEVPAEPARRRRLQLWMEGEKYWSVVLEGAAAQPLLEEVTYQLALCRHERAERLQARLDRGPA